MTIQKDYTDLRKEEWAALPITAQRIRKALQLRGKSMNWLCKQINKSPSQLSSYIGSSGTKVSEPGSQAVIAISKALDVSADYLLGLCEYPTVDKNTRAVQCHTGLSAAAVEKLNRLYADDKETGYVEVLSTLIEDCNFEYLLHLIGKRFEYTVFDDVKPFIKTENGVTHLMNAKAYHEALSRRQVEINLDGSMLLAQKKNLIDSLITSALTDRMQIMADAYQNLERGKG